MAFRRQTSYCAGGAGSDDQRRRRKCGVVKDIIMTAVLRHWSAFGKWFCGL